MKKVKKIGLGIGCAVVILLIAVTALFRNELRSLASIRKFDEYGMFQMTYYGDYGFDDFLKTGAESDKEIEAFVTKRLLKGIPLDLGITDGGCSVFAVKNENGNVLFGRNFDFSYAPSMQVFTNPQNGYRSVSTVNLSFAGFSADNLPGGLNARSFLALTAPYLPFDGVNEKGVAMALLSVPAAQPGRDPDKVTLNTTTTIRLVLDNAANVDEAVELLKQYNIYFSSGIGCHYLIADASGKSVIVEYWDGGLKVVEPEEDYQIATNFIAFDGLNLGVGLERYHLIDRTIRENGGILTMEQAVDTLVEAGIYDKNGVDNLQWTVVYDLDTQEGCLFAHRKQDNRIDFHLAD